MTAWRALWKAIKSFIGWLFFTAVFVFVAGLTYGFRAYCPLESFIVGSIIVFVVMLILGVLMGVWKDEHS